MALISWGRKLLFTLITAVVFCALLIPDVFATDLVFGPQTCQRGTGAPTVFNYTFPAAEPARGFIFKVYNGGLEDTTYELVSSSTITLNGVEILGPSNFNQHTSYLEVPVTLQEQNSLSVEVRGKPGGAMVVKLFPLVVIDSPPPGQISAMTSVSVSGHLYSEATEVTVNGQAAIISGTSFNAGAIPLVEGSNLLTATATSPGGFVGQTSVAVVRDSIAPAITISSPQEGATVTAPTIDIIGSVDDPSATVLVNGSPVPLSGSAFTVHDFSLQIGANTISMEARDAIGNSSTFILHVTYAPPPPAVTLSASPTSIMEEESATLSWNATYAASCSLEPGGETVAASGANIVTPLTTTTYIVTCTGSGGTAGASATVTQVVQRLTTPGNILGIGGVGDQLLTDGGLGYLFSASGLHTATYDLQLRKKLTAFGYDGRHLVSIALSGGDPGAGIGGSGVVLRNRR